jgi:hypothetical protein
MSQILAIFHREAHPILPVWKKSSFLRRLGPMLRRAGDTG